MRSWFTMFRGNVDAGQGVTAPIMPPRDTDHDWHIIGEQDPYYGVLTDPRFHRQNLTEEARAEFFSSGDVDIGHQLKRQREIFGEFNPRSALDFGCGVGRLTRPLGRLTGDAVGVDVSEGMLDEARRQDVPGAVFVDRIPDRSFDWVVSYIVLQHVTPDSGYRLINDLLKAVAPKGRISLQITFARLHQHANDVGARLVIGEEDVWLSKLSGDVSLVPPGVMIMHDYDLGQVIASFYQQGFLSVHLDYSNHGGVVGAVIHASRGG